MMNERIVVILSAYVLDLILGDPARMPHPVGGIGYLAKKFEMLLRRNFSGQERLAGIIFAVNIIAFVYFAASAAVSAANQINRILGFLASVFLVYSALAIKDLKVQSTRVYRALEKKDLIDARKKLSLIVGRDTVNLNEKEVIRASVETVAESTMDGIIAPLFYAFLGGPVLVWIYKAINTLDSMVGYKNERYIKFGWASAKIDSLVNFIPSKITYLFLSISALLYGKSFINSCRCGLRYFFKGLEHNATVTEAAMAGALKVQLGGLNFYSSAPVSKPLIGKADYPLEARHIQESINLSYLCSLLFLLTGIFFILSGGR